ncbi:GNAT family N-acetyltransferase [Metabacillus dongyingensis]|uniref:GNAT family N-acetyltransferase n=1 Tax=Metabacillus dongyingensis TaxID=2874282 RepID=UPI003B8EA7E3
MNQELSIHCLEEHDRETVRQLLIESYSQYEKEFTSPESWQTYLENITSSVDNVQIDRILVAKLGQSVIGTLQLFETSKTAYGRPELEISSPIVRLLAVHPDARGRGVAQALLKESLIYAKSKGADSLYLHSSDVMHKAIQLYEWLGFTRDYSKEFKNQNILVKCYRFDLKREGELHEPGGTRSVFNLHTTPFTPVSGAVERGI